MSDNSVQTNNFVQESIQALTDPKGYFATMPTSGGFGAPVVKALLYGVIAGIFGFIWSMLGIPTMGGFGAMFGGSMGFMFLIMSVVGALIGLFIGGVIMLIISAICGGNTNYEANVRVTASLMVLSPVAALLGFTYSLGMTFGAIIGLLVNLYGVWMLLHALIGSLKAKSGTSKVVAIIIAVIYVIMFLGTLAATNAMQNL